MFKKDDVRTMRNSRFLWLTMISLQNDYSAVIPLLTWCKSTAKDKYAFRTPCRFRGKEFVRRIAPSYATLHFMPRAVRIVTQCRALEPRRHNNKETWISLSYYLIVDFKIRRRGAE